MQSAKSYLTTSLLLVIFTGAFLLRISGLAHDLELGYIYHPDTPKQAVAAQRYLNGEYLYRVGNLNYDGYPFFNSRLAAWLYQPVSSLVNQTVSHLGIDRVVIKPDLITMIWLIRFMNTLLSSLAVVMTWIIARAVFGWSTAWLVAALMAVSPLDIAACHTAMSDTTAAFFVTATLLSAVRIYKKPAWLNYALAGAMLAFGFFSKYHASIAVIFIATSHFLRHPHPASWCSRSFWAPIAFTLIAFILSAACANPGLILDTRKSIQLIFEFMAYTSNFGMTSMLRAMPLTERFWFGISHNLPDLVVALTWPGVLLPLVALLFPLRKKPEAWIIGSATIAYLLIALPFKPLAQAQYHLVILPSMCILMVAAIVWIFKSRWPCYAGPGIAIGLTSWVLLGCVTTTRDELFFFNRPDTRLEAERWIQRNAPESFQAAAGHYTLMRTPEKILNPDGRIMLSSSFRPHPAPDHYQFKARLDMTDTAIESFRNPVIDLFVHSTPLLPEVVQTVNAWPSPAPGDHEMVFEEAPDFLATPRMMEWQGSKSFQRYFVMRSPVDNFTFGLRNGPAANTFTIELNGAKHRVQLQPWEQVITGLKPGRESYLSPHERRFVYRMKLTSRHSGAALVGTGDNDLAAIRLFAGARVDVSSLSTVPQAYLERLPGRVVELKEFDHPPKQPDHRISQPVFLSPGIYHLAVPGGEELLHYEPACVNAATGEPFKVRRVDAGLWSVEVPPGAVLAFTAENFASSQRITLMPQAKPSLQFLDFYWENAKDGAADRTNNQRDDWITVSAGVQAGE